MRKKQMWARTLVLALGISSMAAITAFAEDRVVSSVSIRVNSELEPGDTLPSIGIANHGQNSDVSDGELTLSVSSEKYAIENAEWVSSTDREIKVGDRPEMKVWLTAQDTSNVNYYFKGTYRSSNVDIKYGEYVSAKRESEDTLLIRLKINPVKGEFPAPEDAWWKDHARGTACWDAPDGGGTGKYEVVLRKGSGTVHTVETTSKSYNFYPYMTSKGTYTFRVRTIAKTNREEDYGKKSEWTYSEEIYLAEEDVSDGFGQNQDGNGGPGSNNGNSAGWRYKNGSWYYYYPDGSCQKNSWLQVGGKWYLFQSDGRMLTGWQNRNNQTYYLTDSGEMWTGWLRAGNQWYYLNPTKDSFEGCLLRSRWENIGGKTYYFNSNGAMLEGWNQVDGNWYYFYPGYGHKAVNTWIDTFYVNQDGVWVR